MIFPGFKKHVWIKLLLLLLLLLIFIPGGILLHKSLQDNAPKEGGGGLKDSAFGRFKHDAVATDAYPCADVASQILEFKGNAIDVAVSVLLCIGVVHPHNSGLGGGFLLNYYNRSAGQFHFLDAREVAPLKATVDMFQNSTEEATEGGLSIAVPGEIPGLYEAHSKFGSIEWKLLFKPVIDLCYEGFAVSKHFEEALKSEEKYITKRENFRNVFINPSTNKLFKAGEKMTRPDLAKALLAISEAPTFKELFSDNNPFFKQFHEELKSHGSIITAKELQDYKPVWKKVLKSELRSNLTLYTAPLSGSGPILTFILNVMKGFNNSLATLEESTLFYHRLMETYKFAYGQRLNLEDSDDPAVLAVVQKLMSQEMADLVRDRIQYNSTYSNITIYTTLPIKEDHGTAHMSVIGHNGDAVSVTSTINLRFGSKRMLKTSGIIMNNEMDDFVTPGIVNFFGVESHTNRNLIHPGKRPMSSMSPSILLNEKGDVQLAIGAAGGTRITTMIAYVTLLNQFLGMDLNKAVDAKRLHHQLTPNMVHYEPDFPADIIRELELFHHNFTKVNYNAVVEGIERTKQHELLAVSDGRKGGSVAGT